jgi:hypothetical protein
MYNNEICAIEKASFDFQLLDFSVISIGDITQVKTKSTFFQRFISWSESYIQWSMLERALLVLEPHSLQHLFVLAYSDIYVFRGNAFQTHSLDQSYHPTQLFTQEKYNME